jgi:hypothetical protein
VHPPFHLFPITLGIFPLISFDRLGEERLNQPFAVCRTLNPGQGVVGSKLLHGSTTDDQHQGQHEHQSSG